MKITLSGAARRFIAPFGKETEVTAHDCLVFDDRVIFLVAAGDMATAVGSGGRTIQLVERQLGRTAELAEDAGTPEVLVVNALTPAAARHVTLSRQNDIIAYVEVAGAGRGITIDASGKTIDAAHELARCRYDIDDIQLM